MRRAAVAGPDLRVRPHQCGDFDGEAEEQFGEQRPQAHAPDGDERHRVEMRSEDPYISIREVPVEVDRRSALHCALRHQDRRRRVGMHEVAEPEEVDDDDVQSEDGRDDGHDEKEPV